MSTDNTKVPEQGQVYFTKTNESQKPGDNLGEVVFRTQEQKKKTENERNVKKREKKVKKNATEWKERK